MDDSRANTNMPDPLSSVFDDSSVFPKGGIYDRINPYSRLAGR
jgi:hypothetical protein